MVIYLFFLIYESWAGLATQRGDRNPPNGLIEEHPMRVTVDPDLCMPTGSRIDRRGPIPELGEMTACLSRRLRCQSRT